MRRGNLNFGDAVMGGKVCESTEREHQAAYRILMTTNHPAPYMDDLFYPLSERYELTVIYINEASTEKKWRNSDRHFPGLLGSTISIADLYNFTSRADLIIVGGWACTLNRLLILLGIIKRKRLAIFSDAPDKDNKPLLLRLVQAILLKLVPFYFVTGEEASRIFCQTYWVDPARVRNFPYCGARADKNAIATANLKRARALREPESKLRVFIANRFIARKGYDAVAAAFEILQKKGLLSSFDVVISGDGPLLEAYKDRMLSISPEIQLRGWVEADDYYELMLATDVFVHASSFEPYGIPVVDAATGGKLVIACSGVCSAVDLKNSGYNVRLFPPGDFEELARLLDEARKSRLGIYEAQTGIGEEVDDRPRNIAVIDAIFNEKGR